ncbi:MAG: thiamine-phosphate synthase family protein [bacterium]
MTEERRSTLERLTHAVKMVEGCPELVPLIPEVRTNIVFALPNAQTPDDVAAVDGRITVVNNQPKASGPVRFGASDHLARLVIELRRFDPGMRAALNFRYNERICQFVSEWTRVNGKRMGVIDRAKEPEELIGKDKMSIPWKVKELLSSTGGRVPEIAYETKGWGKEPLFILIGKEPVVLAQQLVEIARGYAHATGCIPL